MWLGNVHLCLSGALLLGNPWTIRSEPSPISFGERPLNSKHTLLDLFIFFNFLVDSKHKLTCWYKRKANNEMMNEKLQYQVWCWYDHAVLCAVVCVLLLLLLLCVLFCSMKWVWQTSVQLSWVLQLFVQLHFAIFCMLVLAAFFICVAHWDFGMVILIPFLALGIFPHACSLTWFDWLTQWQHTLCLNS